MLPSTPHPSFHMTTYGITEEVGISGRKLGHLVNAFRGTLGIWSLSIGLLYSVHNDLCRTAGPTQPTKRWAANSETLNPNKVSPSKPNASGTKIREGWPVCND